MASSSCSLVVLMTLLFLGLASGATFSIDDYGAVPNDASNDAAWANTAAIQKAFQSANDSEPGTPDDRVVLLPSGNEYYIFNVVITGVHNISFVIDGTLVMSNNISAWPTANGGGGSLASLYVGDSSFITIQGSGLFNGLGYNWWWHVVLTTIDDRPNMIVMDQCTDVVIQQLRFLNSPMYHLFLNDMRDLVVRDIDIMVDIDVQREILSSSGRLTDDGVPIFPLNTDGIDPSGINVLIQNVSVTNYDDAVAVKPMNGNGRYSNCSANMVIRDLRVNFGVGMSIGSVPPDDAVNCIRDILFDNVTFDKPFKALYVKTNPGDSGSGIVNNITYSNIEVRDSLWYPIWFGPQQEHQPGQPGKGCSFFYPIDQKCETQPRVTVSDIKVHNVTLTGGVFLPGVLLCNESNPCTGFEFVNVVNTGEFVIQGDYVCINTSGTSVNSDPPPSCLTVTDSKKDQEMEKKEDHHNDQLRVQTKQQQQRKTA